ncbi:MAG: MFS transporter [Planctomycetaceae bacterium]
MDRLHSSLREATAAFARPRTRRVLVAFTLFSIAEWVRWIGLLVYGFQRQGAAGSAVISVIQLVPAAAITPFASSLADRYERSRVLTGAYVLAAAGTGIAGTAALAGAPLLLVGVAAAVGLCGVTMIRPTQASLLPQLVETPAELTAANVTIGLVMAGSVFVGPALASAVLALAGPTVVMLIGAAMLATGAVALPRTRLRGRAVAAGERVHLFGGFAVLAQDRSAALIVGLVEVHAAAWGLLEVLITALALTTLGMGESGVGVLSAALGIGALVGGGATVSLVRRRRLAPALGLGALLWGAPLLLVGAADLVTAVVVLLLVAGSGIAFLDVASRTLLQRSVSDDALGRVFGLLEGGYMAAWAVGAALAPVLLRLLGAPWAFVIAGALVPAVAVAGWSGLARADRDATIAEPELALLRQVPMFGHLAEPVLERLARNAGEAAFAAGTAIVSEGEPGDLFYVVAEGEVRVSVAGAEVARYGPGEYFGEIALLRDVPRQATVTATSDVRLLSLGRAPFLIAMTGSSAAAEEADREIARRLGSRESR